MTVAVELDAASLLGKTFASDTTLVSFAGDEFVNQKRILGEIAALARRSGTRSGTSSRKPKTPKALCYQGDFRSNDILEQFDIADG